MHINEILLNFKNVKKLNNDSYQCKCPCHDDKKNSLTITQKNDKILLYCHAGCNTYDILDKLGIKISQLNNNPIDVKAIDWRKKLEYFKKKIIEDVYNYTDEKGNYLYSKVRMQDKYILYGIINKNTNKFDIGIKNVEKTLYNLKNTIEAIKKGNIIYFVEGEKDVHTILKLGLTATTCGGVGDWKKEFAKYFIGAKVVILPDNDESGLKLKDTIIRDLSNYAHCIKWVKVSDKPKGDITDYIQDGYNIEDFFKLLNQTSWTYAPWIYETTNTIKINSDMLQYCISQTLKYVVFHKKGIDKEITYIYKNGVYEAVGKNEFKGYIKNYIPTGLCNDVLLSNTYNMLLYSQNNTYEFEKSNNNEYIINLKNGLYNLKTDKFEKHSSDILSTIQLNCNFNENYSKPQKWIDFLNQLCLDENGEIDKQNLDILQEWTGLILSNITVSRTKKCLVLYSPLGNTGKSVFLNVINNLLNLDNTINIPIQKMSKQFAMASVYGKRLICIGEQQSNDIEDISIFKQLTGGDPIEVEFKGKQSFNYIFKGGIAFACNNLPLFRDDKGGHIFERLILIPCTNVIAPEKRDGNLIVKLLKERDCIFMWALEGLKRLIKNNLKFSSSDISDEALDEYRKSLDTLYKYTQENCIISKNSNDRIKKVEFEANYTNWCINNSFIPMEKNNIKNSAEKIGIGYGKYCGYWYYRNIKYI